MPVYRGDTPIGFVTSGTMVPYYRHEGEGLATRILDDTAKRAIGLAYLSSDTLEDDVVEVDVRGRRLRAVIPPYHMRVDAPPFARPILYQSDAAAAAPGGVTGLPRPWNWSGRPRRTTSGVRSGA